MNLLRSLHAIRIMQHILRFTFHVLRSTLHALRFTFYALRSHPGFAIILIAFLALAMAYGWTIPTFESPDASGHYAYIHELTEGRGLPVQGEPSGERVTGYVTSHPPLYYLLSAALSFWVPDDTDFWGVVWVNPYHANGYPGSVEGFDIFNIVLRRAESFAYLFEALVR